MRGWPSRRNPDGGGWNQGMWWFWGRWARRRAQRAPTPAHAAEHALSTYVGHKLNGLPRVWRLPFRVGQGLEVPAWKGGRRGGGGTGFFTVCSLRELVTCYEGRAEPVPSLCLWEPAAHVLSGRPPRLRQSQSVRGPFPWTVSAAGGFWRVDGRCAMAQVCVPARAMY